MEDCHARFMELVIRSHGAIDSNDIVEAVRTKNKVHKLIKAVMHLEMCRKALQILKNLFDLENDLSIIIIQELKLEIGESDTSSSSEDEHRRF